MRDRRPLGLRASAARRGLLGYGATYSLAAGVGLIAGLGALAFRWAETEIHRFFHGEASVLVTAPPHLPAIVRLVLPALGILAAVLMMRWGLRRHLPTIDVMEAVVLRRGPMRLREELVRVMAALGVIGTGGSVGPEGPIVELGAALGSQVATSARARPRIVSLLISCGAAAGLAAAFNAPLGAAIFVLEIMIGRLSVDRFAPVVVASVTATLVSRQAWGDQPVFEVQPAALGSFWEFLPTILLGVLGGLLGAGFIRLLGGIRELIHRFRMRPEIRAVVGGLLVGMIGLAYPQVLGAGFDSINLMLAARVSGAMLFILLGLKLLATSVTLGSGGLGGVFAPTLFLGAALGALVGAVVAQVVPGTTSSPEVWVLLGMAALVGATLHAPATAILMLFELTRDYALVPPIMLVTIVATVVSRRLHPWSLYSQRLSGGGLRPGGGESELVLATTRARELMDPVRKVLLSNAPLHEVLDAVESDVRGDVYVTLPDGTFEGWVRSSDLAGVDPDDLAGVAVAGDLVRRTASVTPDTTLADALEVMDSTGQDEVAVVEEDVRLIGVLSRRSVIRRLRSG